MSQAHIAVPPDVAPPASVPSRSVVVRRGSGDGLAEYRAGGTVVFGYLTDLTESPSGTSGCSPCSR